VATALFCVPKRSTIVTLARRKRLAIATELR